MFGFWIAARKGSGRRCAPVPLIGVFLRGKQRRRQPSWIISFCTSLKANFPSFCSLCSPIPTLGLIWTRRPPPTFLPWTETVSERGLRRTASPVRGRGDRNPLPTSNYRSLSSHICASVLVPFIVPKKKKTTMPGLLQPLLCLPRGRGEEWSRDWEERGERRRGRRRKKVGGVWLPSTSLFALFRRPGSPHLSFLTGYTDKQTRDAQGGPTFTPWVSLRKRARTGG